MVSAIIAGVSAAASIAGGAIKSARARRLNKQNQEILNRMKSDNDNFFNRYYNADATQLADNSSALTEARTSLRRNSASASGVNAVMGGTNATSAATKEANSQAYADAVRGVAANAQQYKNGILDTYNSNKQNLNAKQMQVNAERNDANAQAIDSAVNGVGQVASAYIASNTSGGSTASDKSTTTNSSSNNGVKYSVKRK